MGDDWQPCFEQLQNPEKRLLRQALLMEQGYLCCYCGRRINLEDSHIEHFKPQSLSPELALDHENILACCQGESEEPPPKPVHCGHEKGEWYDLSLTVSPLLENCADFFGYTEDGQILPTNNLEKTAAAKTTIAKLALDIPKLQRMRKSAIAGILDIDLPYTSEEIERLTANFEAPNAKGHLEEFCFALIYILNQYR